MSMRYGTIPVARKTGGLIDTIIDYSTDLENANGFLFEQYDADALFNSLKLATDLFKNKNIWHKIISNAMNSDFSWDNSAQKYLSLYQNLLQ